MTDKPTPELLATMLRTALAEMRQYVGNDAFYDDKNKLTFKFDAVEKLLDEHFPNWSAHDAAFLKALRDNGIENGERFLRCPRYTGHYTQIENGSTLYDHWVTFTAGVDFGVRQSKQE